MEQRIISGARVAFDPRTTKEAHEKRSTDNHKGSPAAKAIRNAQRIERERAQREGK